MRVSLPLSSYRFLFVVVLCLATLAGLLSLRLNLFQTDQAPAARMPKAMVRHTAAESRPIQPLVPRKEVPAVLPELPLTLIGTSIQNPESSYAVIRNNHSGKERLYRVGDTIQQAVITAILPDSVVLRAGMRDRFLFLQERETTRLKPEATQDRSMPPLSPEEIAQRYNFDADIKAVTDLMSQIDFSSGLENREKSGVRITRVKPDSIFDRIGLETGDIIVSIDDKRIDTLDDSFEIYETLRKSPRGSILINRNGFQQTLYYQGMAAM